MGVLMSGIMACGATPAYAKKSHLPYVQIVDNLDEYPVAPSEAAGIAMDSVPGSRVLSVKLLPSGVYAVTLKVGGSVTRVMVDATSGSVT